jgi:hypothetical protein
MIRIIVLLSVSFLFRPLSADASLWDWLEQRNTLFYLRGPWNWSIARHLPELHREFNGIDFGHAHLAETLLQTNDATAIEQARLDILTFIESKPAFPPDEAFIAPTFYRLAWAPQNMFDWAHQFHRDLYDLFATDQVQDKEAAYRQILANYLAQPHAITPQVLDHAGALWNFPESRNFVRRFPKFNAQIWAYHWLQAKVAETQLGRNLAEQRIALPATLAEYHGYLTIPPLQWQFMPMFHEVAPTFSQRFPEAANIFDNLHMLHDNIDDVLSSPDLFPTLETKRQRIYQLIEIYLNRNHRAGDQRYLQYRSPAGATHQHGASAMPPQPTSPDEPQPHHHHHE